MGRRAPLALAMAGAISAASCTMYYGEELITAPDRSAPLPIDASDEVSTDASIDMGDGAIDGSFDADAANDADAGTSADADSGPPQNLHPHGDFELGCGGWWTYQSTLTPESVGHASAGSCRVAATVSNEDIFTADDHGAIAAPFVGGRYRVEAWVREADGANSPPNGVSVVLRTFDDNPTVVRKEAAGSPFAQPMSTWQMIAAELEVTQPAQKLGVYVGGQAEIGAAFLLDDVRVYRVE